MTLAEYAEFCTISNFAQICLEQNIDIMGGILVRRNKTNKHNDFPF